MYYFLSLLIGILVAVMIAFNGGLTLGRGTMGNLQRNKENADEVGQGNECGVVFDGSLKIQVGDTLICYKEEEKRRSL